MSWFKHRPPKYPPKPAPEPQDTFWPPENE